MKEENAIIFIVDDDLSIRESPEESHSVGRAQGTDIFVGARIFGKPASAGSQLPGTRCHSYPA